MTHYENFINDQLQKEAIPQEYLNVLLAHILASEDESPDKQLASTLEWLEEEDNVDLPPVMPVGPFGSIPLTGE